MKGLTQDVVNGAKGFAMGAANVIPGVSGGTIALITGIFQRLIDSLNRIMSIRTWRLLFKGHILEFWKEIDGRFLASLFIGILLSVFSLAKVMEYVLEWHPVQTWAFFFGMIAASAVIMLAKMKDWKKSDILWTLAGVALGLILCTLSPTRTPDDMWFVFICGAIAICTMILPGISGSFILLILGKYDYVMSAVSNLDWPILAVFALGCAIGILAFSKFLHWLLNRYERQTMLALVGFIIGSLVKVWPWNDTSAILHADHLDPGLTTIPPSSLHIPSAIALAVAGVILVLLLEWMGNRHTGTPES